MQKLPLTLFTITSVEIVDKIHVFNTIELIIKLTIEIILGVLTIINLYKSIKNK
jgi:hypothetical protein